MYCAYTIQLLTCIRGTVGGAGRATSLSSATARAQACPSPAPLVAGVHSVDPSAGKVLTRAHHS